MTWNYKMFILNKNVNIKVAIKFSQHLFFKIPTFISLDTINNRDKKQ